MLMVKDWKTTAKQGWFQRKMTGRKRRRDGERVQAEEERLTLRAETSVAESVLATNQLSVKGS